MKKIILSRFTYKIVFSSICFVILLFLNGCGNNTTDMQTINIKEFQIDIPNTFEKIADGVVENKQIVNKVIASYKEQQEGFSPNLIVTESPLESDLDFEQFWTANTAKLKSFVSGYTPGDKEVISFDCGNDRIQGIFVSFQIEDSFSKDNQIYTISQYQFIKDQKGYIISTGHIDESAQKNLKKRLKTLHCS